MLVVVGVAATFGVRGRPDRGDARATAAHPPTVLAPRSLRLPVGDRVPMVFGHDEAREVGRVVEWWRTDEALMVRAVIDPAAVTRHAQALGEPVPFGLSVQWRTLDQGTLDDRDNPVCVVRDGVVQHVGLVSSPAFAGSRLLTWRPARRGGFQ